MSYLDHLHEEAEPATSSTRRWCVDTAPLYRVTRLSKWLALALFLVLPFGGFWLGLQQSPTVVVITIDETMPPESVAEIEPSVGLESTDADEPVASGRSGALREYVDPSTGIQFAYPVEWGVVRVGTEYGECPNHIPPEECMMRTYSVQDPASGESAVFLVAATALHGQYPMPRGAFWGDFVHQIESAWRESCREQSNCSLVTTAAAIEVAHHQSGAMTGDGSRVTDPRLTEWYYVSRDGAIFDRVAASPIELRWADVTADEFRETVIATLQFE